MKWWQCLLIGWPVASVVTALLVGPVLRKRSESLEPIE